MKVYHSLKETFDRPVALTIGNFDGVHKGHQFVINRLTDVAKRDQIPSAIITYENHPSEVLRPNHTTRLLTNPQQKLALFKQLGVDLVYVVKFDRAFADQSAETFLTKVKDHLPFRHLILGYDSKMGKDRQGNETLIRDLAPKLHFMTEYVHPHLIDGEPVSSTKIRQAIHADDFKYAESRLGRKYALNGVLAPGKEGGQALNFDANLCLPSYGVYSVKVKDQPAIANLSNLNGKPHLEIHFLNANLPAYGEEVNVEFQEFIRPEKRFDSIKQLRDQIIIDLKAI